MAISYNHTSFPTQQLIYPPSAASQLIGLPLAGARVFTYKSSDHTTPKTTYQTNIGTPPALPNPVVANAIGQVTIYWALNDGDITDLYYVKIVGPTGDDTLYYEYDQFDGSSLIGVTPPSENIDFNFVRNGQFTFNRFKPYPAAYNLKYESHTLTTGVYIADDWLFTKNNTSTTETVIITPFTLGQTSVLFNPVNYFSWNVTAAGSAETFKNVFQQYNSVTTLSGQTVTLQFYARSSTSSTLTTDFRQTFGTTGSPSADVVTPIGSWSLTSAWTQYTKTITIPSVIGKSLGTDGNDALLLDFNLPLNATNGANIDISNIQDELGGTANAFQYETSNDQQVRLTKTWFGSPTGDIKPSVSLLGGTAGWINLNNGTIGSLNSMATTFASENAFALYSMLWTNTVNGNCPVSTGRGASALADFNADKTLTLPQSINTFPRNLTNPTAASLGAVGGASTSNTTGAHSHAYGGSLPVGVSGTDWETDAPGVQGGATYNVPHMGGTAGFTPQSSTQSTGGSFSILNPYTYFYMYIKL